MKRLTLMVAAAVLFFTAPADVRAEIIEGSKELEFYGGVNFPDNNELNEDLTYGVRFGYNVTQQFGIGAALGRYEHDGTLDDLDLDFTYEHWTIDVTAIFHANPDGPAVFGILAGLGYMWDELDHVAEKDPTSDTFSVHAGITGKFTVSDRVYLRVDARGRWFEDDDDIDVETTFAVGIIWE